MSARRVPTMRNRSDLVGGMIHLLAEGAGLVALLVIVSVVAWLMLLI